MIASEKHGRIQTMIDIFDVVSEMLTLKYERKACKKG